MTQLNISIEEAKRLALAVNTFFSERNIYAKIQGGFVRDALLGRPVKDMDVYLSYEANHDDAFFDELARVFYADRGHEYILHERTEMEGRNNNQYPVCFRVYSSVNVAEGDFGVDLIFPPRGLTHPGQFDFGICEASIVVNRWPNPREPIVTVTTSRQFDEDVEKRQISFNNFVDPVYSEVIGFRQLTDAEFEHAYTKFAAHIERIRAKYPDWKVVYRPDWVTEEYGKVVRKMYEDGILEEARPVLPTEASIAARDEVRQLDRAAAIRVMQGLPADPVQGEEAGVLGDAPVQPGLRGSRAWFETLGINPEPPRPHETTEERIARLVATYGGGERVVAEAVAAIPRQNRAARRAHLQPRQPAQPNRGPDVRGIFGA